MRRAGKIFLTVNGEILDAKGNFTYNLGASKREAVVGSDRVHGYKEMPQVAFIEGETTDRSTLDLAALLNTELATVTLELANGKVIVLRNAWYAADGTGNTEEANVQLRFEAETGEEIR
jgi:hypothetical protein